MLEQGTIKDIEGKIVVITIPMHDSCQSCINGMCKEGHGALKAFNRENLELSPGDKVEVEVKSTEQAKGAFWVLGLPLVALFCGYGLGRLLFPTTSEGPAVASASIFFALALGIGFLVQKRRSLDSFPVVTKKLDSIA